MMSLDDSNIGYSESSQDASMSQSMMDTATNDSANGGTNTNNENNSHVHNGDDKEDFSKDEDKPSTKAQLPAPPNVSALLENSTDAQFPDNCQASNNVEMDDSKDDS